MLLLEVCDRKTPALVDSGASVSCVQKSLVDKLKQNQVLNIYASRLTNVTGVGGEPQEAP